MEPGPPAPPEPGDGGAGPGGPLLHPGGVLPHQGGREEDLHQQVRGGHQEGERPIDGQSWALVLFRGSRAVCGLYGNETMCYGACNLVPILQFVAFSVLL